MNLSELARRMGGELVGPDAEAGAFALDSRDVRPGSVFVAIKGERVDGLAFAAQALKDGACAVIAEAEIAGPHIRVSSVVEALANYGRSLRSEFHGPVIGITGSNGKTSSKEMLAAAISPLGPILKSEGNQNTEYTSPLLWQRRTAETAAAIVEMGMRGAGQIAHLARIAQPTHGLITMIGIAHIEMLGTREAIARAKGELVQALPETGTAFLNSDDEFTPMLSGMTTARVQTFGFALGSDLQIVGYRAISLQEMDLRVAYQGETESVTLPTVGRHQSQNAAGALLVAVNLGLSLREATQALRAKFVAPPMRMEIRKHRGAEVLLDTYNASPDSTVAALTTFAEVPCEGRRIVVLGEMKELGTMTELGHRRVGQQLADTPFDRVVLIGDPTRFMAEEAIMRGVRASCVAMATSMDDVRRELDQVQPGDRVLIKGSRALALEQLLEVEV